MVAFTGQFGRGYRKTAILKDGSSGSGNGAKSASDLTNKSSNDAKKTSAAPKKESFDDFFESLMKGSGQNGRTASGSGAAGGVNLDGILSSLNKSPSEFQKEESDSRFAKLFKQKAAEEQEVTEDAANGPDEVAEVDALADDLLANDAEFAEFMRALRVDYDHKKQSGQIPASTAKPFKLPSAVPVTKVTIPTQSPDLSKLSAQQAKDDVAEMIRKANPHLAALHARTPASRSQIDNLAAKRDAREEVELDETLRAIDLAEGQLPEYVVGARVPNPETGESRYVDLLDVYADRSIGQVARLASREADAKNPQGLGADVETEEDFGAPLDQVDTDGGLTAEDEQFLNHPATAKLLEALTDESKSIDDMQYWSLFPKAVKRWLIYTRAPKGFYNDFGEWVVLPKKSNDEVLSDEIERMTRQLARENGLPEGEEPLGEDGQPLRRYEDEEEEDEDLLEQHLTPEEEELLGEEGDFDLVDAKGSSLSHRLDVTEESLEDAIMEEGEDFEERAERAAARAAATEETDDPALLAIALDPLTSPFTPEEELDLNNALNSNWDFWEAQYQKEQQYLPKDLQGKYRFHIQTKEIEDMHPRLRRHFSFKFASEGEITKYRAAEYVRKWGRHPGDTGNSAVQIAILTLRINHLSKILRTNTTDTHNEYRLKGLVRRRKALMVHLKKSSLPTYYSLLKDISLRDQVELWTASRK